MRYNYARASVNNLLMNKLMSITVNIYWHMRISIWDFSNLESSGKMLCDLIANVP